MPETKHERNGSNLRRTPHVRPPPSRRATRRPTRPDMFNATTDSPRDTGRPQSLALPARQEFWSVLERYNKAALRRRFPGWDACDANDTAPR